MIRTSHDAPETTGRAPDWRDRGLCRTHDEPELWFPTGNSHQANAQRREAQAICWRCPVMEWCGQWALDRRELFGVWGGMTSGQRKQILRRRGVRVPHDPVEDAA